VLNKKAVFLLVSNRKFSTVVLNCLWSHIFVQGSTKGSRKYALLYVAIAGLTEDIYTSFKKTNYRMIDDEQ